MKCLPIKDRIELMKWTSEIFNDSFSAVSTAPLARVGAFRFFGFRDFEKEVAWKYFQKRMELELKRCQKIGGASKRASQQNGGGGKKVLTKRRWWCHSLFDLRPPPVCCHLFFATPTLFSPPLFCHPHLFFATSLLPPPTTFLSPLFCHSSSFLASDSRRPFIEISKTKESKCVFGCKNRLRCRRERALWRLVIWLKNRG